MNKKIIIFVIVIVSTIGGFVWLRNSTTTITTSGEPLRLTQHLWPGYYHSYIAREQGFFNDEGVNVEITLVEDIDVNLQAFVDGKADLAFGLQSDAYLWASRGVPLKIIYIADFSNGGDVVISEPNIKSVADLRGKTVGVDKLNGFNHIFLAELLRLNGLTETDVTIVPVKASDVPAALREGRIDAGQSWEPYKSEALADGNRLLATSADAPGIITDVLMVKTDVLKEREEEVRGLVKALLRALEFRQTNEGEAYAIMSEATGVSPGALKDVIQGGNIFPNLKENKQSFVESENPTSLYKSGAFISKFFLDKGIIENPLDLNDIHASEVVNSLQ